MRRIFILLFVTLLAAQSVYAAAARYCEHESDREASTHVGHHGHEHEPAATDERSDPNDAHLDCAFCQLGFAQSLSAQGVGPNLQPSHAVLPEISLLIISAYRDEFLRPPRAPAI
jgi:hypothetical protein